MHETDDADALAFAPSPAVASTAPDWENISRQLREPFDPKDVGWRVQGKANEQTGKAQCVAYLDARAVQDRLDAAVGAGNWSFDWEPLVVDKGEVQVAKGTLTVYGVSKSDAGSASNFEQTLGAVSHCFKRAAVHWGIGRYLYNVPAAWVAVERGGRIPESTLNELRGRLPRPGDSPSAPATPQRRAAPPAASAPTPPPRATPPPTPVPHAPPPGPMQTSTPGGQPIRHLHAPRTPQERMAALGYKGALYDNEMEKLLGRKASYTPAEMARWLEHITKLEHAAAARAATPLEQLTGGMRPN